MKPALERRRWRPRMVAASRGGNITLTVACAVAAFVGGGVMASTAGAADPATQLRETRAAIDQLGGRFFEATQAAKRLDQELAAIDAKIRGSSARMLATRAGAAARAAFLYRSQGADYSFSFETSDAQDDARRVEFLSRANERSNAVIDRYKRAATDLRTARAALIAKQREQQRALATLRTTEQRLRSDLAVVERAYRADAAARQRAAAAARAHKTNVRSPNSADPVPAATSTTPAGTITDPPTTVGHRGSGPHAGDAFLACVRQRESHGVYTAVNPAGYYGAYQFGVTTWNVAASHAGRLDLVGVRPDRATPWNQDEIAWALYQWQGPGPWGGHCP